MAYRKVDFSERPVAAKVVVAGGFGVGKTTFVGAISEIRPLRTEGAMTATGVNIDGARGAKTGTTVAMDFGRVTVEDGLALYVFGTPGQDRFSFMWDDLVDGALGAIVLVDTLHIDTSFAAIDYFEQRELPTVVAVNPFEGAPEYSLEEVRDAVNVDESTPVLRCDARSPESVRAALVDLLSLVLRRLEAAAPPPPEPRDHGPLGATLDLRSMALAQRALDREQAATN